MAFLNIYGTEIDDPTSVRVVLSYTRVLSVWKPRAKSGRRKGLRAHVVLGVIAVMLVIIDKICKLN